MRKCVFSLLLIVCYFSANSQSNLATQVNNFHWSIPPSTYTSDAPSQNNPIKPLINLATKSAVSCADGVADVGSSYDVFSNILNYQNQILYNPDLNAMAFAHNQNEDEPGGPGFISYEYSLDAGETWVTGHKPITPTLDLIGDGSIFGTGNRFPNGTIYNPPGNTDPANAYFVSVGTAFWDNPNGSILGYEYVASSPLIYDENDVSERYYTDPNHTFFRPSALTPKADGTIWYVNTSWDFTIDQAGTGPASFKDFYVSKLTFNSTTKSFDKEIVDTLEMNYTGVPISAFRGEHNMGFSPDGQYGYVAFVGGDADQPQIQASPVIWLSSDGGNSWTKDASLDYTQMTELLENTLTLNGQVDTNDLVNKRPFMLEYDMTVDNEGNLQLFADMYSGSSFHPDSLNFLYLNGLGVSNLFHFIYFQNSGTWYSRLVKPWENAPGSIGNTPLRARPQAGTTPDGKKVFFTWAEALSGEFNNFSSVWASGFDTESSTSTPPKNTYSEAGSDFEGFAKLPTLSPITFQAGGGCGAYDFELPHVISLTFDDPFAPAVHAYISGVGFDETEFTVPVSFDPTADFTFTGLGFTVDFEDKSQGTPSSWQWDFGDGNTSTDQNPVHTYAAAGMYPVCLTVNNDFGTNGPVCMDVNVPFSPVADFSFVVNGLDVNFTDLSTGSPDEWLWDFDDGNTSTEQNPSHSYADNGNYTVCLISSNQGGLSPVVCKDVTVGVAPVADFSFIVNGLDVDFTDLSTGSPDAWVWDFGDGNTSTDQNSSHTYAANGDFTVCLVSSNLGLSSAPTCKTVSAGIAPMADFSFTVNDLEVTLQDLSTNSPTSWEWTFGDGNSSTQQNPVHVYSTAGNYEICLEASNSFGNSGTVCMMVTVGNSPEPDFSFTVNLYEATFTDLSSNAPTGWEWDFGDGNQSTEQNPVHTYATNGTYTVCLTASNILGQGTPSCKDVTIAVLPQAQFSAEVTFFTVELTDLSLNQPTSWEWDFGDGNQSQEQNPIHTYAGIGVYNVCLTAINSAGLDITCQDVATIVGSALEELGYGKLLVYPNPVVDEAFITTTKRSMPDEAYVEVVDAQGKLITPSPVNVSSNGFTIDTNDWVPGLYFFTIKLEGEVLASGKLVKER